jgi:hypothetical protein
MEVLLRAGKRQKEIAELVGKTNPLSVENSSATAISGAILHA